MCVCVVTSDVCVVTSDVCVVTSDVCVVTSDVCVVTSDVCVVTSDGVCVRSVGCVICCRCGLHKLQYPQSSGEGGEVVGWRWAGVQAVCP